MCFGVTVAGNLSSVEAAREILGALQPMGHEVLTTHVVRQDARDADRRVTPREIFTRDMKWLEECDLFMAEVSGSSFGVGFETGHILGATTKRAILFYERSVEGKISLLITGNVHPNCSVIAYSRLDELGDLVRGQVSPAVS